MNKSVWYYFLFLKTKTCEVRLPTTLLCIVPTTELVSPLLILLRIWSECFKKLEVFARKTMNLTAAVQFEYAVLESLVRNGQKNSMSLATASSEFLEKFCTENHYICCQKWKNVLGLGDDERKTPKSLSEFGSCQDFFTFVRSVYLNLNLEERWEFIAIAVACLKLFVEINFIRVNVDCW